MKRLFTYMDKQWVRVKWITLTEPNGTPMGKAWIDYQQFLWDMTKHYKTHFHWVMGGDLGFNAHAHIIASVPMDELERFQQRDKTFKHKEKWTDDYGKSKHVWFQDFEEGHGTEWYACEKPDHTRLPVQTKCPERTEPCRAGRCTHT